MIYLVSNKIDVNVPDIQKISVEDSLRMMSSWPVVQFDTETTGLDARLCVLIALQFGYKDFKTGQQDQVVVDCRSVSPLLYKEFIETHHLIGHNLKFDLQFLYNENIIPLNVYDTMICERVLYLGYAPRQVSFSLQSLISRYLSVELDKSFQAQIAIKGLTLEGIRYSAGDVVYLQDIRRKQMDVAKSRNSIGAFKVECACVPAMAYLEWCGIYLDANAWKQKMIKDAAAADKALSDLNQMIGTHPKLAERYGKSVYCENSLFDNPDEPTWGSTINWNSPEQVIPIFQTLGFSTVTVDKKTHEEKDSVLKDVLAGQKGIDDAFLGCYLNYKNKQKRMDSYGKKYLNQINPKTGRLHTIFRQIGTKSGRMASGNSKQYNVDLALASGLQVNEVTYCNMQNLPRDAETRACFKAMPGNVFISCDYAAEESRVQADVWNEKTLLDSFAQGIDTHNLYAKMCFPEELKDVDVKDVKKVRPDLRQLAKSAEFATAYGSDGSSIATKIGVAREKAKDMVAGIVKGMPGMVAFKKATAKFLLKNGYMVIHPQTGHRIYWPGWSTYKSEAERMDRQFWEDYELYHKGKKNDPVCEMVKKHRKQRASWLEKNVLNYPIQGGSAIVLKRAAAELFRWVVKNNYFNKIWFCVFVHDEIDVECPKELADICAAAMSKIMTDASAMYYKKLPIPATCDIDTYWKH